MASHNIAPRLLTQRVKVLVVGAGGTGSEMLRGLVKLNEAMLALGHPAGMHCTVMDADQVSPSNIGRQAFWPSDVGQNKAQVLVNRINLGFGLDWTAVPCQLTNGHSMRCDLVIGCVDNRAARAAILAACKGAYWTDLGNRQDTGQVILGQIGYSDGVTKDRLPHAADLFPEIVDPTRESDDDGPSCSLADALEKQGLFINQGVATHALSLLWELFRFGTISHHGLFLNMKSGRVTPLAIDPETWKRFGYKQPRRKS